MSSRVCGGGVILFRLASGTTASPADLAVGRAGERDRFFFLCRTGSSFEEEESKRGTGATGGGLGVDAMSGALGVVDAMTGSFGVEVTTGVLIKSVEPSVQCAVEPLLSLANKDSDTAAACRRFDFLCEGGDGEGGKTWGDADGACSGGCCFLHCRSEESKLTSDDCASADVSFTAELFGCCSSCCFSCC